MKILSNVHTHTTWCDGKNTPDEMAKAALALGFTGLGFSSHAPAPFDPGCPGVSDEAAYMADIHRVREEYKGRLCVLCGAEQDTVASVKAAGYDYLITSNHYLPLYEGRYTAVDTSYEILENETNTRYGGDVMPLLQDYYAMVVRGVRQQRPQVVGHFDLVKKYNKGGVLFNEDTEAYRRLALDAIEAVLDVVLPYGGMVEVNTGAMAKGLRDEPYPALFILEHIARRGGRVIITSDSHAAATLNACFDEAVALVKRAGFEHVAMMVDGGFADVPLE